MTARCEQTWIEGQKYFDIEEDQRMRAENQVTRARIIQKILASGQPTRKPSESDKPTKSYGRESISTAKRGTEDAESIHFTGLRNGRFGRWSGARVERSPRRSPKATRCARRRYHPLRQR